MSTGIVTNVGLASVIAAWNAHASRPLYLQAGTGSGQGGAATGLAAAYQVREVGAVSLDTVNTANDTYRLEAVVVAAADASITEVGLFDAATGGNMLVYGDFNSISLVAGDAIEFRVNVTASN